MSSLTTLHGIGLAKLSHASYAAFMSAFSALIKQTPLEKLGLTAGEFTPFQKNLEQLIDANRQIRKDALTETLQSLDKQRDVFISYLFAKIATEANSPEEAISNAALALLPLKQLYSDLARKSLREETVLIQGMILDVQKPLYAPHLTTLGLDATLTKIKNLNTDFENKLAERSAHQAEHPLLSLKELRELLSTAYHLLTVKAFAFNLVSPTPESQLFVTRTNKLIDDTNLARKHHKAQLGVWTEEGGREDEEDAPSSIPPKDA